MMGIIVANQHEQPVFFRHVHDVRHSRHLMPTLRYHLKPAWQLELGTFAIEFNDVMGLPLTPTHRTHAQNAD